MDKLRDIFYTERQICKDGQVLNEVFLQDNEVQQQHADCIVNKRREKVRVRGLKDKVGNARDGLEMGKTMMLHTIKAHR